MTSNCIIDPTVGAYDDVSGPAASLAGRVCVIWMAKILCGHCPGATNGRLPVQRNSDLITVGFGRQTLLGAADTLIIW